MNKLNELKYWKAPSQISSDARIHVFLYLHAQTCINISFYLLHLNQKKRIELNELYEPNELKCWKAPSPTSSHALGHVFLCLHA